jgi:hypothetical protein
MDAGTAGKVAQGGAAAVVGGAVYYGASKVKQRRESVAGAELWNVIATSDDPTSLEAQATRSLRERFGSSSAAMEGMKKAYFSYLSVRHAFSKVGVSLLRAEDGGAPRTGCCRGKLKFTIAAELTVLARLLGAMSKTDGVITSCPCAICSQNVACMVMAGARTQGAF